MNRRLAGTLAGAASLIAILTVVSRLLGFGRWLVQANTVGAGPVGDAYASANQIPNILYEVVAGGALTGAVVPLLAIPLAKKIRADVDRISSALLTWAVLVLVPLALVIAALARPIAGLFPVSRGADAALQQDLITYFLIVFSPQVVLYGVGVVLTGVLQAQKKFLAPVLAPIASTLVVIVSYLTFGWLTRGLDMGTDAGQVSDAALAWLAWGTTVGVAAMSLPLLAPVLRTGVRLRPTLAFPEGVARRAAALAGAGVGGLLAQQATVLTVLVLAKHYGDTGTINVFQYTQAVYLLPYAVLVVPFATAAFPRLAEFAQDETQRHRFAGAVESTTRFVIAAGALGAAALAAVGPAVEVVFSARTPAPGLAHALVLMAPAVVGYGLLFHVSRVLFALERNRLALVTTSLTWVAVLVACVVCVRALAPAGGDGVGTLAGLGLGHSIGMSLGAAVLLVALARAEDTAPTARLWRTLTVAVLGAVLAAVAGRWVVDALMGHLGSGILGALGAGLIGGVVVLAVGGAATLAGDRGLLGVLRGMRHG